MVCRENFILTRQVITQVMEFSQQVTFPQDVGFPCNKSWHLHAMCMILVIHTIIREETLEKSYGYMQLV